MNPPMTTRPTGLWLFPLDFTPTCSMPAGLWPRCFSTRALRLLVIGQSGELVALQTSIELRHVITKSGKRTAPGGEEVRSPRCELPS